MLLQFKKDFPVTYYFDDPETGTPVEIRLRVVRLTQDQHTEYKAGIERLDSPPAWRLLPGRRADLEDEQAKDEKGEYLVSDQAVRVRRIAELTDEARAAFDQAAAADTAFAVAFCQKAIESYLSVEPDQIQLEGPDGHLVPVLTGAQLHALFFAQTFVLRELTALVWNENTMGPLEKKVSRLLSVSPRFLSASLLARAGQKQAEIADAVSDLASADSEPAMESTAAAPSGSTATSSSINARSRSSRTKRSRSSRSSAAVTK